MPVVSPSRYSSGSPISSSSFRSSIGPSSTLEKPYYRTNSSYATTSLRTTIGDRTTEFRSRYSDIDGKRERKTSLVEYGRNSRAPSVTDSDSGISNRYRSERSDRSESRGRDISNTRSESGKNSISDPLPRNSKRNSGLNSTALAMSTAELYNKYSPANYIPLTQRLQMQSEAQNGDIARSKSISSDIGRPPTLDVLRSIRKPRNSTTGTTISEKPESRRSYKEISPSPSYSKRNSLTNGVKDNNGNEVPSVAEIRKRFDQKMTVTKLPANENKYSTKAAVDQYLSQLRKCENGTSGYTKILPPRDDKIVPIHQASSEKNGVLKWEIGSSSSRSNSNSDVSLNKYSDGKNDRSNDIAFTIKLPSERLASVKSQLDPNNPIGKILEKSTVIQVENGDGDSKKINRNSPDINSRRESLKNDIEKQVKAPKHTSNFASYIQISQPIASGTSTPQKVDSKESSPSLNDKESHTTKITLKYIDSEHDESKPDSEEVVSPPGTGFENKTFEHENFLKKRNGDVENSLEDHEAKPMETSTESTMSETTEELSSELPAIQKIDLDEVKAELGERRGSRRADRYSPEPAAAAAASTTCGLNGLRNIGNTCFMNSVLQCLSNTPPLLEYFKDEKYANDINTTLSCMKGALIKAFASVLKELWRPGERDSVVNTTALKSQVQRFAPRFMGYSQQDAQEFLRYLLEGLHEDVNRVTVKPTPIITEIDDSLSESEKAAESWSRYIRMESSRVSDIFVGQLKSTLRCTHCNHDSFTFDPFWDLSLPIPSRTGNLKIQQCLQHFTKEEELDGDEKPTCSKCGVRRKCLKWLSVHKFPQVLVLHLKRFSPTERFRGKLNVLVEFPLTGLDMSLYANNKAQNVTYNLYAVSNHSGTTYSGHYTAYCKHPYTGEWNEYNDSRVSSIAARNVVSPEAYVLFYEMAKS